METLPKPLLLTIKTQLRLQLQFHIGTIKQLHCKYRIIYRWSVKPTDADRLGGM